MLLYWQKHYGDGVKFLSFVGVIGGSAVGLNTLVSDHYSKHADQKFKSLEKKLDQKFESLEKKLDSALLIVKDAKQDQIAMKANLHDFCTKLDLAVAMLEAKVEAMSKKDN
jgi:hypothetical protein